MTWDLAEILELLETLDILSDIFLDDSFRFQPWDSKIFYTVKYLVSISLFWKT